MNRKLSELRDNRAALYEQSKNLLDAAEAEGRSLTDEESVKWDAMHADIEALSARMERLQRSDAVAGDLDGSAPHRAYFELDTESSESTTGDQWFDTRSGRPVRVLERGESFARGLDIGPDLRGLTLGGWLRSIAGNPRTPVEHRALSEGTTTAGGFTVPTILLPEFIDRLRSATVIFQAGARTVQLTSDVVNMARLATDPVVGWHAENTQETASDPTFEQVSFTAKTLIALVRASRELVQDSVNVDEILTNAFIQSMRVELDRVALDGAGTVTEPEGLTNITNVGSVTLGAQLTNYDPILNAYKEVLIDNGTMPSSIIMHPRDWTTLQKLKDSTNQPLQVPPALREAQFLTTTGVPITGGSPQEESTIYVGDFPSMMVGMRSEIMVEVLRERYADYYQFGFLAHMRADVQVEQPENFAMVQAVLP